MSSTTQYNYRQDTCKGREDFRIHALVNLDKGKHYLVSRSYGTRIEQEDKELSDVAKLGDGVLSENLHQVLHLWYLHVTAASMFAGVSGLADDTQRWNTRDQIAAIICVIHHPQLH